MVKAADALTGCHLMLSDCEEDTLLRLKDTAFTRHRKLGAERLLHLLLRRIAAPLQLELDRYFAFLEKETVSKQAFSKARANLNPMYVRKFADGLSKLHAQDQDVPRYREMRLIAIDGTDIALENSIELKIAFGCSGPKANAATALGSLAYGPLDHAIYDCRIAPYATDERDLAKLHMSQLRELGLGGSLLLFDRWYPSAGFLFHTLNAGFSFVMRVREKWNLKADAVKTQDWITLSHGENEFRVRVLKVIIPGGETETLLTNLTEEQLPLSEASELYFKRWGIESAFDLLKSKLQLENFSGKTVVSVLQDFYATVYLADFSMIIANEADTLIAEADQGKELKYARKSNMNRTVAKLRERFWPILLEQDQKRRDRMLKHLVRDIALRPEPIRPDRHPPHKTPRKKRFYPAKKAVLP